MAASGLWEELATDWIVLDGEMLPWNAKAGSLIRDTFAATCSAGLESTAATMAAFEAVARRGVEGAAALAARVGEHYEALVRFHAAYRPFVTPCRSYQDLRFAPFHVLAAEGRVFTAENHAWHMQIAERLARHSNGVLVPTDWREVDLGDDEGMAAALRWFEEITAAGNEGLIIKAPDLLPRGTTTAPSIKVRGREYLRIIYGPEYDRPETLPGLKKRNTGRKRTMARIGTVLGQESLARFVNREPLARVHEVVAAAVAVASEPIDSRL